MSVVFEQVTGEIEPVRRESDDGAAGTNVGQARPEVDLDALRRSLAHRERLLARLSAD